MLGDYSSSIRVHQFAGLMPGPRLIVLGAVHGNEKCGTLAIGRVIQELELGSLRLERGTVTFIPVTNPMAFALNRRQGERNLNRNLGIIESPVDFEDHVANVLCPFLDAHDVLLDVHSFHTPGRPFIMLGPENNNGALQQFAQAQAEESLAMHLGPNRLVEGWLETYEKGVARRRQEKPEASPLLLNSRYGIGTSEYMRRQGGYGVTLECGQHDDPSSPEVAYRAIIQALSLLKMVDSEPQPRSQEYEILKLVDVIDRHDAGDAFVQPWSSFDQVVTGECIGHRVNGDEVAAPSDGYIVFPNPGALPGNEWFYFAVRSTRKLVRHIDKVRR